MQREFILLAGLLALCPVPVVSDLAEACGSACDNYLTELKVLYDGFTTNVNTVGAPITPTVIKYMCDLEFDAVLFCANCTAQGTGGFTQDPAAITRVYAWRATCETYKHVNAAQAVACWSALPDDISQCWFPATSSSVSSSSVSGMVTSSTTTFLSTSTSVTTTSAASTTSISSSVAAASIAARHLEQPWVVPLLTLSLWYLFG